MEDCVQNERNKYAKELAYLDRLYQAAKQKPELAEFICMGVMSFSMAVQRHTSAAPKNAPPLKNVSVATFSLATVRGTSASSPEDASFGDFSRLCYDLWDGGPLVH